MGSIWHPLSSTVNPIVTATLQNRTLPSTEHRIERKRFTTGTSGDFVEWSFRGCLFDSMPTAHIIDKQRPGRMCVYGILPHTSENNIAFFRVRQVFHAFNVTLYRSITRSMASKTMTRPPIDTTVPYFVIRSTAESTDTSSSSTKMYIHVFRSCLAWLFRMSTMRLAEQV